MHNNSSVTLSENTNTHPNGITVLLATYNGERFLKDQINSILAQKDVNLFLLVRDDGSNDSTIDILNEYKKQQHLEWYTGEHLGPAKSFLNLIEKAPLSDYYAFSDQDDIWDEDKLSIAIEHLCKIPDQTIPRMYYSSQRVVDNELNVLYNHIIQPNRSRYANYIFSNVAGCTAVFNRNLRDLVNKKKPDFIIMHDCWIYRLCISCGGLAYADSIPHISYRQHNRNTIGLKNNILSKIHRYIFVVRRYDEVYSLYSLYKDYMTTDFRKFSSIICNYKDSFFDTLKLLFYKDINFKNYGLKLIFIIKVIFRKL